MARKRKRFRRLRRRHRWALNCERVFVVLTSGPFPTDSPEDDLVDAHLSFCPDCRRLAEALQPTESMLAGAARREETGLVESIPAEHCADSLPGYWKVQRRLSALDELDFAPVRRSPGGEYEQRYDWRELVAIALIAAAVVCGLVWIWRAGG